MHKSVDAKVTAAVNEAVLVLEVKRAVREEARIETDRDLQYELEPVRRERDTAIRNKEVVAIGVQDAAVHGKDAAMRDMQEATGCTEAARALGARDEVGAGAAPP
jgi:hypothetical protein